MIEKLINLKTHRGIAICVQTITACRHSCHPQFSGGFHVARGHMIDRAVKYFYYNVMQNNIGVDLDSLSITSLINLNSPSLKLL